MATSYTLLRDICGLVGVIAFVACAQPTPIPTSFPTANKTPLLWATPSLTPSRPSTQPPQATPTSRRQTATPTPFHLHNVKSPIVDWTFPEGQVSASFDKVRYIAWQSEALVWIIRDTDDDADSLLVNVNAPAIYTPTPFPTRSSVEPTPNWLHHTTSPDQNYSLECGEAGLKLFAEPRHTLLSQASVPVSVCLGVVWVKGGEMVAFASEDGAAYLWHLKSLQLEKIASTDFLWGLAISPNHKRLALVHDPSNQDANMAGVTITSRDGQRTFATADILDGNGWAPNMVGWLTDDIWFNDHQCGAGCSFTSYYSADTGLTLTTVLNDPEESQLPSISPEGRWMAIDQSNYERPFFGHLFFWRLANHHPYFYELFDAKQGYVTSIADTPDTYLVFKSWSDQNQLYVVSRPVSETARASTVPWGLLMFDPATGQFTSLFQDAVEAVWSPDHKQAWMLFPTLSATKTLELRGGIFDLGAGTLNGRELVSEQMLYASPLEPSLTPIEWSHSGDKLVFSTSHGELVLLYTDGTRRLLATNLPAEAWPQDVHFFWSPDDQYLAVQYRELAWVITVP